MVGSYYFLWTKSDWEFTKIYGGFYERTIAKYTKARGYDIEKEKALEQYVAKIEAHLKMFESSTA